MALDLTVGGAVTVRDWWPTEIRARNSTATATAREPEPEM